VQCAGSADVRSAVNFARAENLLVAVKCGGHSASGKSTCDGGMMIDLSLLRNIRVDPFARTAHVAGGSLLGEMDHDTMEYGLVTTAGTVSHTGVAGLTLGGGFGRVGRRFGLAADNVLEVDIITADGEFHRASKDENPDLYWAVRGGGGNFGVVTSFKFQLHPMQRQVIRGHFEYAESDSRNALNFFAEYADNAPDDLYIDGRLFANRTNSASVALDRCYSGPHDQADALLAPIRKAGKLLVDDVRVLDYDLVQKMGDNLDPRNASYLKSGFTGVITPQLVDDMLDVFEPHPDRTHMMYFQQSGGAIGRVAENATAFAQREAKHNILCVVGWPKETDGAEHIAYIREVWNGVESHTRGFYVNDMKEETQVMINRNYRGNYDRLVRIKNKYDPGNLFRLNANVQPSV
jgi:FAD/FMN-containing dehydrogenase